MEPTSVSTIAATVICAIVLIGFFATKTKGFGDYTAPLMVVLAVLCVGTLAAFTGKLDVPTFSSLIYTIGAFAGGWLMDRAIRRT